MLVASHALSSSRIAFKMPTTEGDVEKELGAPSARRGASPAKKKKKKRQHVSPQLRSSSTQSTPAAAIVRLLDALLLQHPRVASESGTPEERERAAQERESEVHPLAALRSEAHEHLDDPDWMRLPVDFEDKVKQVMEVNRKVLLDEAAVRMARDAANSREMATSESSTLSVEELHTAASLAARAGRSKQSLELLARASTIAGSSASTPPDKLRCRFIEHGQDVEVGDRNTFSVALSELIGPPNPNLQQSMEAEHCGGPDSLLFFKAQQSVTGRVDTFVTETCSRIECK